jgi:hypothetical protein
MPLDTLIADTRKAITEDPARAQAAFTTEGTLLGVHGWSSAPTRGWHADLGAAGNSCYEL